MTGGWVGGAPLVLKGAAFGLRSKIIASKIYLSDITHQR